MNRIALLVVVVILACSGTAFGQERAPKPATAFALTTASYLALSATDFYLSNRCIQAARCDERGPLYRGVATHPLAFGLVKMSASSALALTAWQIRKTHPRAAWALLAGLTVGQGAIDFWNVRQGRR